MDQRRVVRKWLDPYGDADSYVRLDLEHWGSQSNPTRHTQVDLKVADCSRSIHLGFYVDAEDPKTKRKALRKLQILEDTLAQARALIEVSGE